MGKNAGVESAKSGGLVSEYERGSGGIVVEGNHELLEISTVNERAPTELDPQ